MTSSRLRFTGPYGKVQQRELEQRIEHVVDVELRLASDTFVPATTSIVDVCRNPPSFGYMNRPGKPESIMFQDRPLFHGATHTSPEGSFVRTSFEEE